MKNLVNIKPKDNITFGILFFIFFLIIGLYPLKSGGVIRIWSIICIFNIFNNNHY